MGEFCDRFTAARNYGLAQSTAGTNGTAVGILLPPKEGSLGYSSDQVAAVTNAIGRFYDPVTLAWPPVINSKWIARIRTLNWMVVDVGPVSMQNGVVGFLHGEFKPAIRLVQVPEPAPDALQSGAALPPVDVPFYRGFDAGYPKDIAPWWNSESLLDGVEKRITCFREPRKRITTSRDALDYFLSAALRKEAVFVSYCGRDQDVASDLIAALRRKFQQVFDYRDGKSIRPGQPWLKEIFDQLAVSPIGIPLLSPDYVDSGNCGHELEAMVAQRDDKKMQVIPIKLRSNDTFKMPVELGNVQYARRWEYPTAEELVEWIAANIPR